MFLINLTAQDIDQRGMASYYGKQFHGRRSSDGSVYHRDSLTCAHRTLPFGTLLKVRNTNNGKEVIVKVTDRGPFTRGRIVDLSYAAAKEISMVQSGVARVEVSQVSQEEARLFAQNKRQTTIKPELQLFDPTDGEYYAASEFTRREEAKRQMALQQQQRRQRLNLARVKQQQLPRYKVLADQLTASAQKGKKAQKKK